MDVGGPGRKQKSTGDGTRPEKTGRPGLVSEGGGGRTRKKDAKRGRTLLLWQKAFLVGGKIPGYNGFTEGRLESFPRKTEANQQEENTLKKTMSILLAAGFAVLDAAVEEPMKAAIRAAGAEGDSVGDVLETAILGLPAGIGEPYFDSVESEIAHLAFSIPAVKGIEFGTGFGFAGLRGSEANDAFRMTAEGAVVTATNHNAGINGGIANGMPVVFRTAVKPTPSIYKQQDTVDYIAKKDAQLSIQGRHDPCIVPRAAIVQTCAAALAVGDLLTARYGARWMTDPTGYRKED